MLVNEFEMYVPKEIYIFNHLEIHEYSFQCLKIGTLYFALFWRI